MFLLFVIGDSSAHGTALRSALDASGVACELKIFDSDLAALCHLKSAAAAPDVVLVNGVLMVHDGPQFIRDLKSYPLLTNSRFAVMDPLKEDLNAYEEMRVPLVRKPVTAQQIKSILMPGC